MRLCNGRRPSTRLSVRLSVGPIVRQPLRRVAGLLPSAPRAGRIDRQWQAPAPSSNGAMGVRTQGQMGLADPHHGKWMKN